MKQIILSALACGLCLTTPLLNQSHSTNSIQSGLVLPEKTEAVHHGLEIPCIKVEEHHVEETCTSAPQENCEQNQETCQTVQETCYNGNQVGYTYVPVQSHHSSHHGKGHH